MMNSLQKLNELGQSVWLDNLNRDIIENGEIPRKIKNEGLRGITSNPAIFQKALREDHSYEDSIHTASRQKMAVSTVYEELIVEDVRKACDLLMGVYKDSDGADGYVSLEVSPYLAYDAAGTVVEANRLADAVNRPNLMIKVPGTRIGFKAIEELLYSGINVNITLLFSEEKYEETVLAYCRALERRVSENRSIKEISSVASFFLSRIDVLVDQLLSHRLHTASPALNASAKKLLGRSGIASAKCIYRKFRSMTQNARWKALQDRGARVQRVLWASTSTKNPDYSDVMYIEPLIGSDTVSTMPEITAQSYLDHGRPAANTIEDEADQWMDVFNQLESLDIQMKCVTEQLKNEGVQKFIQAYEGCLELVKEKMKQ